LFGSKVLELVSTVLNLKTCYTKFQIKRIVAATNGYYSVEFWGLPQQFLEKTRPLYVLYLTTLLTLQNTISTQKALKVPSEVAATV